MKFPVRVLFTIFLLFALQLLRAQSSGVAAAEYFWDNDPGQGNGTAMSATDGSFGQAFENISQNTSNLPDSGLHKLSIRSQDINGNWGPVFSVVVRILGSSTPTPQDKVIAGEYFWDNDPGQGSGNPMIAYDGNFNQAFEAISQGNIGLPAKGAHTLNVRAEDAGGNWGPVFTVVVQVLDSLTKAPADKVTAAEYFWDNDPGQGNGNPMVAFDGNFNQAFEAISQSNIGLPSAGGHTLNVRAKDVGGNWGPVFTVVVQVLNSVTQAPADNISAAEYFWDNDPGQGSGNPMVAFDGNFNQAFEAIKQSNVGLPSAGVHTLNLRAQDVAGNWGSVFTLVVQVLNSVTQAPADKVTAAEYFWDNDPGQGNGNAMVAFDGNFNQAFETLSQSNIGLPSSGVHTLNIRAEDVNGNWGPVFTVVVNIQNNSTSIRSDGITSAEYFFDTDPGQGNATPMLAQGGNFGHDFQSLLGGAIPAPVTAGIHLLSIRSKDVAGNWGQVFSIVVNIDTTLGPPNVHISGEANLCNNSLLNNLYSTPLVPGSSYAWSITGGSITSGADTNKVSVNWNNSGPYKLKVSGCNGGSNFCSFDSLIPVIKPVDTLTINQTICEGLAFDGYRATGVYNDTFTAVNGCDSIRVLNLNVLPASYLTIAHTVCYGEIYLGHNQTATYIDTFTAANGCDSIRTLNLTVLSKDTVTVNQSICPGQSFLGHSSSGTFVDTLTASTGCDSIRTLHLTVLQISHSTVTKSICYGELYAGYDTSGTFIDTLTSANGCDSIRTLNLTVRPLISTSTNHSVCYGYTYQGHSATGVYADTLTASNGCDSISTLNLTVQDKIAVTVNQSVCTGQIFDGHSGTGTFVDTFTAVSGCDSVRTLNLTAANSIITSINKNICTGEAYDGHSQNGTYVDTFTSIGGCDSIRTLYLLILPTLNTSDIQVICAGLTYGGHNATGTYVDTLTSSFGCDSIRTLHLTVTAVQRDTIRHNICQGDTFENHSVTGTYTDSLTSVSGCDSVVTLQLLVNQPPSTPTITRYGNTLVASSAIYYQWYRDSVVLSGDTNIALVLTQSGKYQVEESDSFGCSSRSAVYVDTTLGISNINYAQSIQIFPNPTNGQINITMTGNSSNEPLTIKVSDMLGRTLISQTATYIATKINLQIDIGSFASGMYMLQVKQGNWVTNAPVVLTK